MIVGYIGESFVSLKMVETNNNDSNKSEFINKVYQQLQEYFKKVFNIPLLL